MKVEPFLKWAGGKRWLVDRNEFDIPKYTGKYIEPFLGGGAVFFSIQPSQAVLSDINGRLVETYIAIRDDWSGVYDILLRHQQKHSKSYYYEERALSHEVPTVRAAQFLYLNRACWNGLYRENLKGQFNVPIGTKSNILLSSDDFSKVAELLSAAIILESDFEPVIDGACAGDLLFVDPPYTTAHNYNGFVKYNQRIFRWADQERLAASIRRAVNRGVNIVTTNASHPAIRALYDHLAPPVELDRSSVISGKAAARTRTAELLYVIEAR